MPPWLFPLLLKYGVPLLITILQKTGAVNWAERLALKVGAKAVEAVEEIKAYQEYPADPKPPTSKAEGNININQ
jgi:hypothetical protein